MNPFANNNQQKPNPFSNTSGQGQSSGSLFNNNNLRGTQMGASTYGNQGMQSNQNNQGMQGTNMFSSQNQSQNMFSGNQGNQGQGMFNNNNQGQNQNKGQNMFSGGNQGQNMFSGGNQGQNMFSGGNQGQNMFSGGNQGQNMFSGGNQGQNMFSGGNQGQNMFSGGNQNKSLMFNNEGGSMYNQGNNQIFNQNMNINNQSFQQNYQDSIQYHHHIETIRHQLEDCVNRIKQKSLDQIKLEPNNIYRDTSISKLNCNNQVVMIMKQFQEIKKKIDEIKSQQSIVQKKSEGFTKAMHQKLALYKKCLLQTTTHDKMITEIRQQVELMNKQMDQFFKPLFHSYRTKKTISLKEPNQFDMKISYMVLNQLQALSQRVDDLMICQQQNPTEHINQSITVFEQLVQYYENVSCTFRDFKKNYDVIKRQAIEKQRKGTYQSVIAKVQKRARDKLREQYRYYDLIKEIDGILTKRQIRAQKKWASDYARQSNYEWN